MASSNCSASSPGWRIHGPGNKPRDSARRAGPGARPTLDGVAARADLAASLPALVAERRAALWRALAPELLPAIGGRLEWVIRDGNVMRVPSHRPPALMHLSNGDWLVLFEPDHFSAALVALAPSDGPTLEQRLTRIAAIDAERPRIEGEHARLIDRAGELGVTAEHLEVTRIRRQAERNERERQAHREADDARSERLKYGASGGPGMTSTQLRQRAIAIVRHLTEDDLALAVVDLERHLPRDDGVDGNDETETAGEDETELDDDEATPF